MSDYLLVTPSAAHQKQVCDFIREFREHGSDIYGTGGLDDFEDYAKWLDKLDCDRDSARVLPPRVPADTFFFVRSSDNAVLGMVNIRHRLNDFLLREGGHIGYCIRPAARGFGHATRMLHMALNRCREVGLDRVLVVCDKDNPASARVIQKNGGTLENEPFSETYQTTIQRYWIAL